jgi:glutathione S-transferase
LTLHQPPPPAGWNGIPNMSPFCAKLETYLRMARVEYKAGPADPRKAPKGKIPYVTDGGRMIGDSALIIEHLKQTRGDPLDAHLGPEERAQALVIRRTMEESTYFSMAWLRWMTPESWTYVEAAFKALMPPVIGGMIVKGIKRGFEKGLRAQGTGRHTREEILAMVQADLMAFSRLLGEKQYFLGERPTSLDATMYGFLVNILWVPWDGPEVRFARTLPNLGAYCERMKRAYWT